MISGIQSSFSHFVVPAAETVFFHGIVPAVTYLAKNCEKVESVYNAAQAWCTRKANQEPHFYSWFATKQIPFYIADTVSLIYTIGILALNISQINELHPFLPDLETKGNLIGLGIVLVAVGFIGIVTLTDYITTRLARKEPFPPNDLEANRTVTLKWNSPMHEDVKRWLYIARVIVNITLFCLNPYNPFFLLNAALEVYSLALLLRRKWVLFTKEIPAAIRGNNGLLADRVSLHYFFLLRSPGKVLPSQDNDCAICLDPMDSSSAVCFCDKHFFHKTCLLSTIQSKANEFANGIREIERWIVTTRHYTNGIYTHSTQHPKYSVRISKSNLPSCPLCRQQFDAGSFNVSFHDVQFNEWSGSSVILQDA